MAIKNHTQQLPIQQQQSHDCFAKAERDIETVVDSIRSLNLTAEQRFLELGTGLQKLYEESVALTHCADHAAKTVSSDNNISEIIHGISNQILNRFNGVKKANMETLEHASHASRLLKQLAAGIPEIRKIDKQLWILGSNMAIQSSGSPHTQTMFGEYSEELKQFSKSIKGVILDFQNDLKGMSDSLQTVQSSIKTETVRLDDLIRHSQKNIDNATSQLEALMADSMEKVETIEQKSKLMSKGIADIVTSIQFNDITRQQMEHVIEALEETKSFNDSNELYRCMRVQSAQLHLVTETLDNARTTLENSFESIAASSRAISEQYSNKSQRGMEINITPFTKIKTALHELDELLELSAKLRANSIESLKTTKIASVRLSSHLDTVSEITGDLNLQAINALVMSRNIGRGGSSLVALSKEVHSLSKESTTTVDVVVNILKQVGDQTEQLSTLMTEEKEFDNSPQIKEGFEKIDTIGVSYFSSQEQTSSLSISLSKDIEQIRRTAQFIQSLASSLVGNNDILALAADELSVHVTIDDSGQHNLKQNYTMESERIIHDMVQTKIQDQQPLKKASSMPIAVQDQTADDEFGDFELF